MPWPNLVAFDESKIYVGDHGLIQLPTDWQNKEPWSSTPMILDFMQYFTVPHKNHQVVHAPSGSFYLVDLTFFDFNTDYFSYLSTVAQCRLRAREIKILFTYGEADNMPKMQERIFELCDGHSLNPMDMYFTMGRTITHTSPANFIHLNEDFFLYQYRQGINYADPLKWHGHARSRIMTLLNRVHKDWRAHFAAWFWHRGYHKKSYFSYRAVLQHEQMSVTEDQTVLDHYLEKSTRVVSNN